MAFDEKDKKGKGAQLELESVTNRDQRALVKGELYVYNKT